MSQPDLVIFDCDGVLIDSEIIAARVESELITEAGFEISAEELAELYAGLTFQDIMLRIEEVSQVPFSAALIDRCQKLVTERLQHVPMIEGAAQAVMSVTAPRCICSNSSAEQLDLTLGVTGLKPLFGDKVYSAKAVGKPKPAPDVYLYAAKQFGADPRNTFVIEDSVHGVHGAKAAGTRVIGFTGASHTYPGHADALTEAGAETVISRWRDFPAVLAALSEWEDA